MALPRRIDVPAAEPAPPSAPAGATRPPALAPIPDAAASPWGERRDGFDAGGEVGRIHAELAARLAGAGQRAELPHERLVRLLSVGGGYAALAAGYAGVVVLLLR